MRQDSEDVAFQIVKNRVAERMAFEKERKAGNSHLVGATRSVGGKSCTCRISSGSSKLSLCVSPFTFLTVHPKNLLMQPHCQQVTSHGTKGKAIRETYSKGSGGTSRDETP